MEKSWGITIPQLESDITDRLKNPRLEFYIPAASTFQQAKRLFKAEFIKKELRLHKGNISQLAKTLEIDRRSIHRTIKDLDVDLGNIRNLPETQERYQEQLVDEAIRTSLDQYRDLIQPEKMEKMYIEVPCPIKTCPGKKPSWNLKNNSCSMLWKKIREMFPRPPRKSRYG